MGEVEDRAELTGLIGEASLHSSTITLASANKGHRHLLESRIAELLTCIQPSKVSEEKREAVINYVEGLIRRCFDCQVFTFGSVPLKTYLPHGDIDVTAFGRHRNLNESWVNDVQNVLESEEKRKDAEFCVKEVQCINAEVKIVKCLVENIVVDISFNQVGGLCTLYFLDEVDWLIGKNHLFKRSIILVKAWCFYESRLLGAHHGLISTYALEVLVLYIFHIFHSCLHGPLEVLFKFLEYFSNFDWDKYCLSLWGPILLSSLPEMAAEPPCRGGKLLLSNDFLKTCSNVDTIFPNSQDTQPRTFLPKYLNVVDPLRANNNLGRSVSKSNFFRIRSALSLGARRLAKIFESSPDAVKHLDNFFANTWERHNCGHCPDVLNPLFPISDTKHESWVRVEEGESSIEGDPTVYYQNEINTHKEAEGAALESIANKISKLSFLIRKDGKDLGSDSPGLNTAWVGSTEFHEPLEGSRNCRNIERNIVGDGKDSRLIPSQGGLEAGPNVAEKGSNQIQRLMLDRVLGELNQSDVFNGGRLTGDASDFPSEEVSFRVVGGRRVAKSLVDVNANNDGEMDLKSVDSPAIVSAGSSSGWNDEFSRGMSFMRKSGYNKAMGNFPKTRPIQEQVMIPEPRKNNNSVSVASKNKASSRVVMPSYGYPSASGLYDQINLPYSHQPPMSAPLRGPGMSPLFSPIPRAGPPPPLALHTGTSISDNTLSPGVICNPGPYLFPRGPLPPPMPPFLSIPKVSFPPNLLNKAEKWKNGEEKTNQNEVWRHLEQQQEQPQQQPRAVSPLLDASIMIMGPLLQHSVQGGQNEPAWVEESEVSLLEAPLIPPAALPTQDSGTIAMVPSLAEVSTSNALAQSIGDKAIADVQGYLPVLPSPSPVLFSNIFTPSPLVNEASADIEPVVSVPTMVQTIPSFYQPHVGATVSGPLPSYSPLPAMSSIQSAISSNGDNIASLETSSQPSLPPTENNEAVAGVPYMYYAGNHFPPLALYNNMFSFQPGMDDQSVKEVYPDESNKFADNRGSDFQDRLGLHMPFEPLNTGMLGGFVPGIPVMKPFSHPNGGLQGMFPGQGGMIANEDFPKPRNGTGTYFPSPWYGSQRERQSSGSRRYQVNNLEQGRIGSAGGGGGNNFRNRAMNRGQCHYDGRYQGNHNMGSGFDHPVAQAEQMEFRRVGAPHVEAKISLGSRVHSPPPPSNNLYPPSAERAPQQASSGRFQSRGNQCSYQLKEEDFPPLHFRG